MNNAELQAINYILNTQDMKSLISGGIDKSYFKLTKKEYEYLEGYYKQYRSVPPLDKFKQDFPEFIEDKTPVKTQAVIDDLVESAIYNDLTPHLEKFGQAFTRNSIDATEHLQAKILEVRSNRLGKQQNGTDIVANAKERYEDYQNRKEKGGLLGISTGIKDLDKILCGWLPKDFMVLYARTNVGKSWLGLYFGLQAWKQGKRVMFYAGEMSVDMLGFRFDTLNSHLSNYAMIGGKQEIEEEYKQYTEELSTKQGFKVFTTEDFGNRKPTVQQIEEKAMDMDAEIIILDQISLMEDARKGKTKTEKYGNIAEDTFLLSQKLNLPIIALAQAGRESSKVNADEAPELHHIEYSDLIGQYATRAIGMNVVDKILKLNVKKNRFGGKCDEVLLNWDIDTGRINPLDEGITEDLSNEFGF